MPAIGVDPMGFQRPIADATDMDLRTGQSPWDLRAPTDLTPGPLEIDEACDVLVVGSGISGAMAAFHLAQAGADVVVVDRRPLSVGSTTASTALIQYELDVPMVDLVPRLGLVDAQAVYRATRMALNDMRDLVLQNDFDCDLTQRPTLYLAKHAQDVLHLQHEAVARAHLGLEATWLDAAALATQYGIHAPGAIRSSISYELDPQKLTEQLLKKAADDFGVRLYDRTRLAVDPWVGSIPTLRSDNGHSIHAGHIVYATGYETPDQFPQLAALCRMKTTFALVTPPVEESRLWSERALLWEFARPFLYARTTADNRIIIGGEDEPLLNPAAREEILPAKTQALLERFSELTGLDDLEADQSWAATFADTDDGLPYIGSPDCAHNCFFNLGFGGNGILFALIGAQIIRDGLHHRTHPAARLLGFDRASSPTSGKALDLTCP